MQVDDRLVKSSADTSGVAKLGFDSARAGECLSLALECLSDAGSESCDTPYSVWDDFLTKFGIILTANSDDERKRLANILPFHLPVLMISYAEVERRLMKHFAPIQSNAAFCGAPKLDMGLSTTGY